MNVHKIRNSYSTQYANPIVLEVGEVVKLGVEEKEEKWIGWIWAESKTNS